jgi:ABC-type branched-subunit amino acid transport system permease subunit
MSTSTSVTQTKSVSSLKRESPRSILLKRLAGCLLIGFVLALMVGQQEGTQSDYGYAFRQAVSVPRIFVFLGIGVLIFLLVTYADRVRRYVRRPGVRPLAVGALSVVAGYSLLRWTDSGQIDGGTLSTLSSAARDTHSLDPLTRAFFGSIVPGTPYLLLLVVLVLAGTAIVLRRPALAWSAAGLAVLGGLWGVYATKAVDDFLVTPDHSTGAFVALLGYLAIASACVVVARSDREDADTRGFIDRAFSWRPGLPLVVIGLLAGLVALVGTGWFSPGNKNDHYADLSSRFSDTGINTLTSAYLTWLGTLLFVVVLALAVGATFLRRRDLGWGAVVAGVVSIIVTLMVMHDFTAVAAKVGFDTITKPWTDLGVGGWLLCIAYTVLAGAGWIVVSHRRSDDVVAADSVAQSSDSDHLSSTSANFNKVVLFVVIAVALFYPPMATPFWQTVLVSEIGIYVLLAMGLNVVVGWAGLLDLGFIAFYAIGSYTTAFLVGVLPVRPPHWAILPPLAAIPFAILICLLAGVALGTPTLRLRGDYLAIVTLGFGEIIRITAINNPANFTNGPRGAINIPHPHLNLGVVDFHWGLDALPYWYLLLVLITIIYLLFTRLENSRLGRSWAAIREDEVAAQATGINTPRVKLLAFAIGASTSGVAGVFFASQVGVINPDNFLLENSILVVAYVVFGGMGSLPGAMAGAAVLTWLPEFLKDQVPAEDRQMWIGALILVMMIFRPQGLIPAKRRQAELKGLDRTESSETVAVPAGEGM